MNIFKKLWSDVVRTKAFYAPGVTMMLGGSFNWNFRGKEKQLSKGFENKIVYAVVNVLVKKLVEAPVLVSKVKNQKQLIKLKHINITDNTNGRYNVAQVKALEELETHPLIDLLNNPNNYQTGVEIRESFWYNYELTGDGFLFVEKNGDKPVFIHCLPSHRVSMQRVGNDWRMPITSYKFSAWDGTIIDLPFDDVMHMKKWSPNDPLQGGFSPLQAVGASVAKNDANDTAQGAIFENGGTGTIVSSDILVQDGEVYSKLSTEQVDKIQRTVDRDWTGVQNNGRFHVTNGTVKVDKFGDTLVDMNAIAADNQDAVRIASGWGVSPILIGDMTGGTDSNVAAAYKSLVTNVVVPELRKFDDKFKEFMRQWYKGERIHVGHDLTEFSELAPDLQLMKQVYGDAWYISPNEKRRLFNFDNSEDKNMDRYVVPMGLAFFDTMEEEFDVDDNATVL